MTGGGGPTFERLRRAGEMRDGDAGIQLEFRMLGALEVSWGRALVPTGGPKQRLVLAHLLIHANRMVPADRLITGIWAGHPPAGARKSLASYVSHLRAGLRDRIRSQPPGYLLEVDPHEVDALRFEARIGEAKALLPVDPKAAVRAFRDALSLWRGEEPLADLANQPSLQPEIARLRELRAGALEDVIEAELVGGAHGDVIAELERLTHEHPGRERLWRHLIVAMYRSGRQADAMRAFDRARAALLGQAATALQPDLVRLHELVLLRDPLLDLAGPEARTDPAHQPDVSKTQQSTPPMDPPEGRREECDTVARFLDRLTEGPASLLVVGDPGIGKTTVWEWGRAAGSGRGLRVLTCRPVQSEMPLAFASLADLLEPVMEAMLPDLPPPQRRALEVALLRAEPHASPPDQRAVSVALLTCLRAMAIRGPVLLAVDDLQWLDGPSARALEFGLRRLIDERVGLLATVRSDDEDRFFPSGSDRVRLSVGPLSLGAVRNLVQSKVPRTWPRAVLVRIHEAADGNPFFALEIARSLALSSSAPPPTGRLPVPRSLRALVASRIALLPEPTRAVLRSAAALNHPTVDLLAAAHPTASVEAELDQAEEAGLIDVSDGRVRFAHPLMASAVYADAGPTELRRLHQSLAGVVKDREERAGHLALAAHGPDERVAATLLEAARSAASRGAPAAAAHMADLAFRLTPSTLHDARLARGVEFGEHLYAAAELDEAASWLEKLLADLPPGTLRARALWIIGSAYAETDVAAAVRTFELALEATDDPILLARTHVALNYIVDVDGAIRHTEAALALMADRPASPALRAEAMAALARTRSGAGLPIDRGLLRSAVELEDSADHPPRVQDSVHLTVALLATREDDFDTARRELRTLRDRALSEADEYSLNVVSYRLGQIELWAGDLVQAARLAAESFEAAERPDMLIGQSNPLSLRALVLGLEGRTAEAEQAASRAAEIGRDCHDLWYESAATWALGFVALCADDPGLAVTHYDRAGTMIESLGLQGITLTYPFGDHIEALIALGDLDRTAALLERFEARAASASGRWATGAAHRCRAVVHAARGQQEEAVRSLGAALDIQRRLPIPLELGRSWMALGMVHRRGKQRREARESLRQALAVFEGMGAISWANKARAQLDSLGYRVTVSPYELTGMELRVAESAAAGKSNQEIAAELFMSIRTVEAHLSRTYRKLVIRSRAQLARALDGRRPVPDAE
jgi:DNA-binding SARP family transcriptional activator/DNA-binding CsgD family transcriptional regulator